MLAQPDTNHRQGTLFRGSGSILDDFDAVDLRRADFPVLHIDRNPSTLIRNDSGELFHQCLVPATRFLEDIQIGQHGFPIDADVEDALAGLLLVQLGEVEAYAVRLS